MCCTSAEYITQEGTRGATPGMSSHRLRPLHKDLAAFCSGNARKDCICEGKALQRLLRKHLKSLRLREERK